MTPGAQRLNTPRSVALGVVALALAVVAPTPIGPRAVRAVTGPDARWTFDAGIGNTVADSIGTATGTRVGGATWLTSGTAVGAGAMHFDGVDGHVDVANQAALEPAGLTLTMWVRAPADDPPLYQQVLVQKGSFACDGPSWAVSMLGNGFRFTYRGDGGQFLIGSVGYDRLRTPAWDGGWHFLSFSVGGSEGFFSISADGSPKQLLNWTNGPIDYAGATAGSLRIGGPVDPTCGGSFFEGDMDDVRIYADPNFDASTLLTPIPTTTVLDPVPSPIGVHDLFDLNVAVTPAPRWGTTWMEFVDLATGDIVDAGEITLAADGTFSAEAQIPAPAGDYELRVSFLGQGPWQPSSDTVTFTSTSVPTATTLSVSPASTAPLTSTALTATIVGSIEIYEDRPEGSVAFYDSTSGTPVLLGTAPTEFVDNYQIYGKSQAVLTLPSGLDVGSRKLSAVYTASNRVYASSTSPTVTVEVPKASVFAYVIAPYEVEANHSFLLQGGVSPEGTFTGTGATMSFERSGVVTPICTVTAQPTLTSCTQPALASGTYQFRVFYSGNANALPTTSDWLTVNVVPDLVHATGVTTQYTTFYPVKDAYKDTLAIKGSRGEAIGVTIKIYKPSGTLLKTVTIASGTGAYSYTWNGRTSGGTLYAGGKYKVTQTLKDAAGTSKTYTFYVTVSKKKIYLYTRTITKLGSSVTAKGTLGTGTLSFHPSTGYTRLKGGSNGWAGLGWQFTLPTATVYKSIKFQIYARSGRTGPPVQIGMQNFSACPYAAGLDWNTSCFDKAISIGNASNTVKWYTSNGSVTTNRFGTRVRGALSVPAGTVYVYKARVVVVYGLLK